MDDAKGGGDDAKSDSKEDDATSDGSDGKKDRDEESIPRARFVAALKDQEERLTRKFEEALAKSKEKPADKPRDVTRADLLALVDEGKMTLLQADQVWEKQIIERAEQRGKEAASREVTQRDAKRRIDEELRRYKESIPAAWRDGSDERARAADEYRHLVSIGQPESIETELLALRSVFGPIEKISKAKSKSQPAHDSEEQTGAGDGDKGGKGKDGSNYALVKTLSAREREHYDAQIKAKRYKGWAEVEAELKFANQDTRRKFGAKV